MKVIYISWNEALRICYELAGKIIDDGEIFDSIVTISRGGVVPARILSDVLGIDDFHTIRSKFWGIGGKIADEPIIKLDEMPDIKNKKILVVDEVVDTGSTLTKIINLLRELGAKQIKTATLHYKASSSLVPDYYARKLYEWVWIFYPWSLSETLYELSIKEGDSASLLDNALRIMEKLKVDQGLIDNEHLSKSLNIYLRRFSRNE